MKEYWLFKTDREHELFVIIKIEEMYRIDTTPDKKVVTIHLEGDLSEVELVNFNKEFCNLTDQIGRKFTVISNIEKMNLVKAEHTNYIKDAQAYGHQNGMERVIRIVKNINPLTKMQWGRTGRLAGYRAEYADTMEEALKMIKSA